MKATVTLADAEHTQALGAALGRQAQAGAVLALEGPLGAGKTCLAQGLGMGLGVCSQVVSPSFQILAVYEEGRLPLFHADLYRLGDASELTELGLEDALSAGGVMAIEWASRFGEVLPPDHLELRLEPVGVSDKRILHLRAHGPLAQALLRALAAERPEVQLEPR